MPFYKQLNKLPSLDKEQPTGFLASINARKADKVDISSVDGLLKLAQSKGLIDGADDATKEDKLSFLQRLSIGLGSFNPSEAIARDYEGAENFLTAYPKTVLQGIASAITGNDYGEQTKRRFFSDLVEDMGVENKYARFGLGLVGDIFLDPTTYLGGTIMRGANFGIKTIGKTAMKGIEKASPEAAMHLAEAGSAIKSAASELFVFGYGASKVKKTGEAVGLAEEFLEYQGKKTNVLTSLALSNAKRHGTDVMTDSQWEEFLGYLFKGKSAEFQYFDEVTDELLENFNRKFPGAKSALKTREGIKDSLTENLGREASDIEVRNALRQQILNKLESTTSLIPKKIGKLQKIRDELAQPFIQSDLFGLKSAISELRKELAELTPKNVVKKGVEKKFMATPDKIDSVLLQSISSQKQIYKKMIVDLEARINGILSGLIEPAEKTVIKQASKKGTRYSIEEIMGQVMRKLDPNINIKDEIVKINDQITQLVNDMSLKQHLLEGALAGKQIAKERIAKAFKTGNFSDLPKELVSILKPEVKDPVIAKALEERLVRNAEVAKKAGIEDPFVMYAPSINKNITERQRILNFFNGTRSSKIGSKDFTKEFRNLLKESELLNDRSLFLRVEDEIATNELTEQFLNKTIEDYGLPLSSFKTEQEAIAKGYKVLKTKGQFGKELGYVTEGDWKFLNGQINGNFKALDAIAKATGFDAATSLFKRSVTGLFAPFHIRNYASGEMQNFELIGKVAQSPKVQANGIRLANKISQGAFAEYIDPFDSALQIGKKVAKFADNEVIELGGKSWKINEIGEAIERRFGGSSRYNTEYNSLTSDADKLMDAKAFSKESIKEWSKSFKSTKLTKNPVEGLIGENNPLFKQARTIGGWIEMQQKSKLVVAALEKGHTIEEALQMAAKAGFDYRALTQFESKVLRRIIPFYSFNRKNVELQLKVLGENPQRINQIIRGIDNVHNLWETNLTDKEKENLPAYLKEYLSVPVGRTKEGVSQFVRSFGTPIEAFTELVKFSAEGKSSIERTFLATLSKVNPYIKVPIELGIQKDSFRQRDLKDVYTATEFELLDKIGPNILSDWLRLKKVQKKDYETGRPRYVYVADPERLLVARSLFTSRGFTYFNNIFNGDVTGFFKILDAVSGIRTVPVDIERQAGWTERRKEDELGALLRRYGIVSEFNKLFIPKQ